LSLKKGETLVLYAQVSSDWWKGANKRGDEGLIPDKYILLKIRDEDMPCSSGSVVQPTTPGTPHNVPPPLTTPPQKESSTSRSRTSSDSVITMPMLGSQNLKSETHARSFSVSDAGSSKTILSTQPQVTTPHIVEVKNNGVAHESNINSSVVEIHSDQQPGHGIGAGAAEPETNTPAEAPSQRSQPPKQVKTNIQAWEQRLKGPSSITAPDLVMDLPQQQGEVAPQVASTNVSTTAPIPPKFTDTSSSEDSDSSESSSANSSPSTPTKHSGAEVFAKQKNATLKKRSSGDVPTVVAQIAPQPTSSWSTEQRGGMFTFSSTFNKPQVKVKPVVLNRPSLPKELVFKEEEPEEEASKHDEK